MTSTVVLDRFPFLLDDMLGNHLIGNRPEAHGEIAPRPEISASAQLAKVRELLKEDLRADPFKPLQHHGADILMGTVDEEQVELIACHLARENLQLMLDGDLADEIAHTNGDRSHEQRLPMLGDPDYVDPEITCRVRAQAICWRTPIRPHSSFRLKARGFHHPPEGTLIAE